MNKKTVMAYGLIVMLFSANITDAYTVQRSTKYSLAGLAVLCFAWPAIRDMWYYNQVYYEKNAVPFFIGGAVLAIVDIALLVSGNNIEAEVNQLQQNDLLARSFVGDKNGLIQHVTHSHAHCSLSHGLIITKNELFKSIKELEALVVLLESQQQATKDDQLRVKIETTKALVLMLLGTAIANSNYIEHLLV